MQCRPRLFFSGRWVAKSCTSYFPFYVPVILRRVSGELSPLAGENLKTLKRPCESVFQSVCDGSLSLTSSTFFILLHPLPCLPPPPGLAKRIVCTKINKLHQSLTLLPHIWRMNLYIFRVSCLLSWLALVAVFGVQSECRNKISGLSGLLGLLGL